MVIITKRVQYKNAVWADFTSDVDQYIKPVVDGVKHQSIYIKAGQIRQFTGRGKIGVKEHVLELRELGGSPKEKSIG